MTDTVPETKEDRIRRILQGVAFQIGFGLFFFGLAIQSCVLHGAQMAYYAEHKTELHTAMMFDTVIFLIGAAIITRGVRSFGKALMLIAGMNPNPPKKN